MIRFCTLACLALSVASASVASAQPQLHSFRVLAEDGDVGGRFNLTQGAFPIEFSASASSSPGEVTGITISMSTYSRLGVPNALTAPVIRQPSGTVGFTLPQFLETGTYRFNVGVVDSDGQVRRWTSHELANAGFPNTFEVVVTDDLSAPTVVEIEVPGIEDPASPGVGTFTLYDPSGVLGYRVVVASPSSQRRVIAERRASVGVGPGHRFTVALDLSTGPDRMGPAEEGWWTIAEIQATDSNGTAQTWTTAELASLGVQSRFSVGAVPTEIVPVPGCGSPNPVARGGQVRLAASADVFDVRGRRVARAGSDGTLATASLGSGVYLVRGAEGQAPCRFTVTPR